MKLSRCYYCGVEIDAADSYRQVIGWTRKRDRGGANQISGRVELDNFACIHCIGKLRSGINPDQMGL